MRDKVERLVVLPFSIGCISQSSVDVLSPLSKPHQDIGDQEAEENMKNNGYKLLTISKPEISTGINRIFKSFKTISQLFVYKDENEEEEEEEIEKSEMEIGVPTNVKHVSHIGWESDLTATSSNLGQEWEHLISQELLVDTTTTRQNNITSNHYNHYHFHRRHLHHLL